MFPCVGDISVLALPPAQCLSGYSGRSIEKDFLSANLLVRFIIVMIWWTGLASWEFELFFPGSLTSTFLGRSVLTPPPPAQCLPGYSGRGTNCTECAAGAYKSYRGTGAISNPSFPPPKISYFQLCIVECVNGRLMPCSPEQAVAFRAKRGSTRTPQGQVGVAAPRFMVPVHHLRNQTRSTGCFRQSTPAHHTLSNI